MNLIMLLPCDDGCLAGFNLRGVPSDREEKGCMMTIEMIKKEKENVKVNLYAGDGTKEELFWDGMLQEIPIEYNPLEVRKEDWLLGSSIYRMYFTYEEVAGIQNGVEHFRKMIRRVLLLEGMQPKLLRQIAVREVQG